MKTITFKANGLACRNLPLLLCMHACCTSLYAAPRDSADYSLYIEITDAGGTASSSTDYSSTGSAGGIIGVETAAGPADLAKNGFMGQIYNLTGLNLQASPATVSEGGTQQLVAFATADDATSVALPGNSITWSVLGGPLAGVNARGVVSGGPVYQNTAASVRGIFGPFSADLPLTVTDTIPDNFGSYAGDGIPDSWQNQYFGLDNPLAAPGADANGTGQSNLFKYTAGLNPLDPNSRFVLEVREGLTPAERRLVFYPRLPDRTYTIEFRTDLVAGQWDVLGGTTFADQADTRTIVDPNAGVPERFYRVRITKP